MKRYLRSYRMVLRTVGPVFVGSGRDIGKKESIWMSPTRLGIPDIQRLYREMVRRKKQAAFEKYLLEEDYLSLTDWLRNQKIRLDEIQPYLKYTLDCVGVIREKGKQLQVKEGIKDAYGNAYIPGSTLKGMLRTILLGADIINHPEKYRSVRETMEQNAGRGGRREYFLQRDMKDTEGICYRVLQLDQKDPDSGVNDSLRGLIVSDSEPLPVDSLVLCQKIDLHVNGDEESFPLLRECIRPLTEIRFTVTVDTNYCDLTKESLYNAVKTFMSCYYNRFSVAFKGTREPVPKVDQVYCGGGCGFATKTIIYPMYGKADGIEMAQKIFRATLNEKVYREHMHDKDKQIGVSPHTMKCTRWNGQRYQMGLCRIEKMEEISQEGTAP